MSRIKLLICSLLVIAGFSSCNDDDQNGVMQWGETDYYPDFPLGLYDYEPVQMTKTLCFETNDIMQGQPWEVEFGLFKKDEAGDYLPVTSDVVIYKNGERCEGNKFKVKSGENEVNLGIEFSPTAQEGTHKWYLKVLGNECFNRINDFSTEDDSFPLLLEMKATKNDIYNPLTQGLCIAFTLLIIVLIVWFALVKHLFYPTFKIGLIQFVKDGYYSNKHLSGARKLVVSSTCKKQGVLNRIFTGKIVYECNDVWTDSWELHPNGKKARFVSNRKYFVDPIASSLEKQVDYTIEHMENGMKVKVTLM